MTLGRRERLQANDVSLPRRQIVQSFIVIGSGVWIL